MGACSAAICRKSEPEYISVQRPLEECRRIKQELLAKNIVMTVYNFYVSPTRDTILNNFGYSNRLIVVAALMKIIEIMIFELKFFAFLREQYVT